jgi:hypothetical protein
VTASLDFGWITEAEVLRRRGLYVVAVIVDPTSFGAVGMSFHDIHAAAEGAGIRVYPVKLHDDLTQALSFTAMPIKV